MALARVSGFTTKKFSGTANAASGIAIDVSAAAGNAVVLILATDGNAADTNDQDNSRHTSIVDTKGNTWTKKREWEVQFFGRTAVVSVWVGKITAALTAGVDTLTITVTAAGDDQNRKLICSEQFSGATNGLTLDGSTHEVTDVADAGVLTLSGLSSTERLYVRGIAEEGGDNTWTVSTNYTLFTNAGAAGTVEVGGTVSQGMKVYGEYHILTGTGDTTNPTHAGADGRGASVYLALSVTPASAGGGGTPAQQGKVPSRRSAIAPPPN